MTLHQASAGPHDEHAAYFSHTFDLADTQQECGYKKGKMQCVALVLQRFN